LRAGHNTWLRPGRSGVRGRLNLQFTTLNKFLPALDTARRARGVCSPRCATTRGGWHEVEESKTLKRQHTLSTFLYPRAGGRPARADAHLRQLSARKVDS